VFIVVSLACLVEARRLSLDTHPGLLTQRLGPGLYIYILGGVLLATGVFYVVTHLRSSPEAGEGEVSIWRVLSVTLAIAMYALLIERFGYAIATVVFFVVMFWLFGVRRWFVNLPLSLGTAAVFYVVFIRLFDVIFRPGIWFDPFV
jgi:uncharacterized membrane protein HdeD (DUF308 family)